MPLSPQGTKRGSGFRVFRIFGAGLNKCLKVEVWGVGFMV